MTANIKKEGVLNVYIWTHVYRVQVIYIYIYVYMYIHVYNWPTEIIFLHFHFIDVLWVHLFSSLVVQHEHHVRLTPTTDTNITQHIYKPPYL